MKLNSTIGILTVLSVMSCSAQKESKRVPDSVSGIYPRLAYYNNEGEWDSLKGFPFLLSLSHSPLPTYAFIPHRHLQYYPKLLIRYWDNDIPVCFLKKRPKDD